MENQMELNQEEMAQISAGASNRFNRIQYILTTSEEYKLYFENDQCPQCKITKLHDNFCNSCRIEWVVFK